MKCFLNLLREGQTGFWGELAKIRFLVFNELFALGLKFKYSKIRINSKNLYLMSQRIVLRDSREFWSQSEAILNRLGGTKIELTK